MEYLVLLAVAVFLTCGAYLILDRTILRIIIGTGLLSNGVNLLLLTTGGLTDAPAPILHHVGDPSADPLPQALILTAIVIGFGVTALLLVLGFRTYESHSSDDLGELHGRLHDE